MLKGYEMLSLLGGLGVGVDKGEPSTSCFSLFSLSIHSFFVCCHML